MPMTGAHAERDDRCCLKSYLPIYAQGVAEITIQEKNCPTTVHAVHATNRHKEPDDK
ncbi:hypothetical protein DPMN_117146 [Dreissena polymorpha]|uniref:Uncharacterized protein n=1 Tax=Dreissena polymorpha TaxID=45954 RepID=A0A9D4KPG4_DREPO|nr:hypothetical protein DPMN_117146 [Dreissena polymorpha]